MLCCCAIVSSDREDGSEVTSRLCWVQWVKHNVAAASYWQSWLQARCDISPRHLYHLPSSRLFLAMCWQVDNIVDSQQVWYSCFFCSVPHCRRAVLLRQFVRSVPQCVSQVYWYIVNDRHWQVAVDRCIDIMLVVAGRKRLKCVMDILSDSDEMELVVFTMTLVNKVCIGCCCSW